MKAQKLLIKLLKKELKTQGVLVNKFTEADWDVIAYEWVLQSDAFIEETIGNDITENPKLFKLAKRRKALVEDEEDDD